LLSTYDVTDRPNACCDVTLGGRPGLIDHRDDVSPPVLSLTALLSYGEGAGHIDPCHYIIGPSRCWIEGNRPL